MYPLFDLEINYWAVLVAGVSNMVIGALWYSPILFSHEHMEKGKKTANVGYFVSFLWALLTAFVLAHFLQFALAETLWEACQTAFWLWLAFMAPVSIGSVLWEGKPLKVFLINAGYNLVTLVVAAKILVAWPA